MSEFLAQFSSSQWIALISIVGGTIFIAFTVAGELWLRAHKTNIDAKLKNDMLDRGMSADEIRTVLDAGTYRSFFSSKT
jgi:hypothetical protein